MNFYLFSKIKYTLLFVCIHFTAICFSQEIPVEIGKLMKSYPSSIIGYENNMIILSNGEKLIFDDRKNKTKEELLDVPCIKDMFLEEYPKGLISIPKKGSDPGRIRNERLFKAMYGDSKEDVMKNLTTIQWCPNLVNSKLKITTKNDVHIQLQKVSDELDKYPEFKKFLIGASTFNWRVISGTDRLSSHSFGTAIDINVKYSNYWQWGCRCKDENIDVKYRNQISQKIVDIFEKHGFIWGGKWYHYDTMHFEYRPELLMD